VYVRRGWLYACVGYCNSPLNNKNIRLSLPVVFSRIGFPHKSLCQLTMLTMVDDGQVMVEEGLLWLTMGDHG
jgi:hypothetical protein